MLFVNQLQLTAPPGHFKMPEEVFYILSLNPKMILQVKGDEDTNFVAQKQDVYTNSLQHGRSFPAEVIFL